MAKFSRYLFAEVRQLAMICSKWTLSACLRNTCHSRDLILGRL